MESDIAVMHRKNFGSQHLHLPEMELVRVLSLVLDYKERLGHMERQHMYEIPVQNPAKAEGMHLKARDHHHRILIDL